MGPGFTGDFGLNTTGQCRRSSTGRDSSPQKALRKHQVLLPSRSVRASPSAVLWLSFTRMHTRHVDRESRTKIREVERCAAAELIVEAAELPAKWARHGRARTPLARRSWAKQTAERGAAWESTERGQQVDVAQQALVQQPRARAWRQPAAQAVVAAHRRPSVVPRRLPPLKDHPHRPSPLRNRSGTPLRAAQGPLGAARRTRHGRWGLGQRWTSRSLRSHIYRLSQSFTGGGRGGGVFRVEPLPRKGRWGDTVVMRSAIPSRNEG